MIYSKRNSGIASVPYYTLIICYDHYRIALCNTGGMIMGGMEIMTDYQLKVILQLIIDKLENCKTIEDFQKAKEELERMKEDRKDQ